MTERQTVYFDRDTDYLTTPATEIIRNLLNRTDRCAQVTIGLQSFADPGEDSASDGKDLSDARAQREWHLVLKEFRGGMAISWMPPSGLLATGILKTVPASVSYAAMGQTDLPVRGTQKPDVRNQVTEITTSCRLASPR